MARSQGTAVTNSFIKGLITEATGLNFPENACTDTDNCVFARIGDVTRRVGIDLEAGFTTEVEDFSGAAVTEFLWKSAALNGELVFVVVQVGDTILFYKLDSTGIISTGLQAFSVTLTTFKVAGSPDVGSIPCSFASGNGVLFVTHPYCEPFYVSYDLNTSTITSNQITVKIRDMRGLDQSASVANHNDRVPIASITPTIFYNLLNQGWATQTYYGNRANDIAYNQNQVANNSGLGVIPIGYLPYISGPTTAIANWFQPGGGAAGIVITPNPHSTVYPSEAETWWLYTYPENPKTMDLSAGGEKLGLNAPSAKGHFIYPAFNINRSAVSMAELVANGGGPGTSNGLAIETSGYFRPAQVAFFAGRAFYAGVASKNFSTKIYFTKVTEQTVDYGRCYQILDPTSQEGGDLVADDGGVIVIPDMAQVIKLFSTGTSLFVFATNGIWKISGSLGNTGFAANAYAVTRISTINAQSALNFVDVEGMPVWWNNDGIWILQVDQLGTTVKVESLSLSTIATYVDEQISGENKRFVKGAYNPFSKIVQWIYRSTEATTVAEQYQYDRLLNFDTLTKAFYPWSLPLSSPTRIAGIFVPQGTITVNALEVVVDSSGATVTTSAFADVEVHRPTEAAISSIFKYIVITPSA